MRKIMFLLVCILGMHAMAQDLMRITMKNGTSYEFSINNINEMDFYTSKPINVVGEWIKISGSSMVLFDIKNDGTLKRISFSMNFGRYYEADETYTLEEDVLTMSYSGQTLPIPIVEITDTRMVSSSGDIYYRVQEPAYTMHLADNPMTIGNEGDSIKYVDGCFVDLEDNKIKALKEGRGYALVEVAESGAMKAYSIEVTPGGSEYVDFTQYFKKTFNQIENVLGDIHQTNLEKHTITYTNFSSCIRFVTFTFSDNMESKPTSEVISVSAYFYDEEKMQSYSDHIANTYILDSKASSDTRKTYYDAENAESASVKITVSTSTNVITYTDLKQTPASVVDWTQYFKKSGDQIKAEFGDNPSITDDDEDEDYSYLYSKNIGELKRLSFSFTKGFEKVTSVRATFNDASSMQVYCDVIGSKYKLYTDGESSKVYYDTDAPSTASIRIIINTSRYYISYYDMSE